MVSCSVIRLILSLCSMSRMWNVALLIINTFRAKPVLCDFAFRPREYVDPIRSLHLREWNKVIQPFYKFFQHSKYIPYPIQIISILVTNKISCVLNENFWNFSPTRSIHIINTSTFILFQLYLSLYANVEQENPFFSHSCVNFSLKKSRLLLLGHHPLLVNGSAIIISLAT